MEEERNIKDVKKIWYCSKNLEKIANEKSNTAASTNKKAKSDQDESTKKAGRLSKEIVKITTNLIERNQSYFKKKRKKNKKEGDNQDEESSDSDSVECSVCSDTECECTTGDGSEESDSIEERIAVEGQNS